MQRWWSELVPLQLLSHPLFGPVPKTNPSRLSYCHPLQTDYGSNFNAHSPTCVTCHLASWGRTRPKVFWIHIFRNFLAKCLQWLEKKVRLRVIKDIFFKNTERKCVSTLSSAPSAVHLCSSCIQLCREPSCSELYGLLLLQPHSCCSVLGLLLNLASGRYFALF